MCVGNTILMKLKSNFECIFFILRDSFAICIEISFPTECTYTEHNSVQHHVDASNYKDILHMFKDCLTQSIVFVSNRLYFLFKISTWQEMPNK